MYHWCTNWVFFQADKRSLIFSQVHIFIILCITRWESAISIQGNEVKILIGWYKQLWSYYQYSPSCCSFIFLILLNNFYNNLQCTGKMCKDCLTNNQEPINIPDQIITGVRRLVYLRAKWPVTPLLQCVINSESGYNTCEATCDTFLLQDKRLVGWFDL